jgi:GNAT superfamily N-acetyltransferase
MEIFWDEIKLSNLDKLERVLDLYDRIFPREVREPHHVFIDSLNYANERKPNNFRFLVGHIKGEITSFATGHYLVDNNSGFIVYLATNPFNRGKGLGIKTLLKLEELLEKDARAAGNHSLKNIILETEKMEDAHNETERKECIKRTEFFKRNGYRQYEEIHYYQPPLHQHDREVPLHLFIKENQHSITKKEMEKLILEMYREKYYLVNKINLEVLNLCLEKMNIHQVISQDYLE